MLRARKSHYNRSGRWVRRQKGCPGNKPGQVITTGSGNSLNIVTQTKGA